MHPGHLWCIQKERKYKIYYILLHAQESRRISTYSNGFISETGTANVVMSQLALIAVSRQTLLANDVTASRSQKALS